MKKLNESFRKEHREMCLERAKLALVLAFIFNVIFTATDAYFSGKLYPLFFVLRASFAVQIVLSYLFLRFFRQLGLRFASLVILLLGVSIGLILSIMCFYTGGFGSIYGSGFIFVLLTVQSALPWHPGYQVLLWVFHQFIYLSLVFFLGYEAIAGDAFSYNWLIFAVGFLSSITTYLQYRMRIQLKEAEAEIVRSETLSAIGERSAGVAHNINTYMSGADIALTMLEERCQDAAVVPFAKTALESVRSTKNIVTMLEGFTQKNREGLKPADVEDAFGEVIRLLSLDPKAAHARIYCDYALTSSIVCDSQQIKSALLNLLKNGVQSGAANIWVSTRQENNHALISVRDDGPGIPEKIQSKIFEPFFTTKDVGEGTGLGLWMVYRTVAEHGGKITVLSKPGEGTEFKILLPVSSIPSVVS